MKCETSTSGQTSTQIRTQHTLQFFVPQILRVKVLRPCQRKRTHLCFIFFILFFIQIFLKLFLKYNFILHNIFARRALDFPTDISRTIFPWNFSLLLLQRDTPFLAPRSSFFSFSYFYFFFYWFYFFLLVSWHEF